MGNAIFHGELYHAIPGDYEKPNSFLLLSKHELEGFTPYQNGYCKMVMGFELDDYYELDYDAIVKGKKCQIQKMDDRFETLDIVENGYFLKEYYKNWVQIDRSFFLYYHVPLEDVEEFQLKVFQYGESNFKTYQGKKMEVLPKEEFQISYAKEILARK